MKQLTQEHIERIGKLADACDNYLTAATLPFPLPVHLEGLTAGLRDVGEQLKAWYREATGNDPWAGGPFPYGPPPAEPGEFDITLRVLDPTGLLRLQHMLADEDLTAELASRFFELLTRALEYPIPIRATVRAGN